MIYVCCSLHFFIGILCIHQYFQLHFWKLDSVLKLKMGNKFVIPVYQIATLLIFSTLILQFLCVNADETNITYYYANKCDTHPSCNEVCGNFKGLQPRCDRNGICVCDCTNMETINSNPVPEVCKKHISSVDHDSCIKYSQNTYGREQARICGIPGSYLYCTALCKWY